MSKWLWKYGKEENSLWREVITRNVGTGTLVPKHINTTFGVNNWKPHRALWEDFPANTELYHGNAKRKKFWPDKWVRHEPL